MTTWLLLLCLLRYCPLSPSLVLSISLKPQLFHSAAFSQTAMVSRIYGIGQLRIFLLLLLFGLPLALSEMLNPRSSSASVSSSAVSSGQISSNSVLVALLDSHYTELAELVEKAMLLQTLEDTVGSHNITIFAPRNEALERDLDPEFKRFLLEPGNLKSLQTLLMFHIIPTRIGSE